MQFVLYTVISLYPQLIDGGWGSMFSGCPPVTFQLQVDGTSVDGIPPPEHARTDSK